MATQTPGISFWTFKAHSKWGNIIQWGRTCSHVRFPLSEKGTFQVLPRMSLVRTKLDDILVCMRNPPTHPGVHSFEYLVPSWLCVWTVGEDCRSFRSWRLTWWRKCIIGAGLEVSQSYPLFLFSVCFPAASVTWPAWIMLLFLGCKISPGKTHSS